MGGWMRSRWMDEIEMDGVACMCVAPGRKKNESVPTDRPTDRPGMSACLHPPMQHHCLSPSIIHSFVCSTTYVSCRLSSTTPSRRGAILGIAPRREYDEHDAAPSHSHAGKRPSTGLAGWLGISCLSTPTPLHRWQHITNTTTFPQRFHNTREQNYTR